MPERADSSHKACQFATPGEIAQAFHEVYERAAEGFGYKTRDESAVPWADVPENNKALMIATVRGVLIERRMVVKGGPLVQELGDARTEADRLRETVARWEQRFDRWQDWRTFEALDQINEPREPRGAS